MTENRLSQADRDSHDYLSRLSEASLRISESLDLDTVLQNVLDSARLLTGARYGVLTTWDEAGKPEEILSSGLTGEQLRLFQEMSGAQNVFECLAAFPGPLRVTDLADHARSLGHSRLGCPVPIVAFLAVPLRHRGDSVGNIHLAKTVAGEEFSAEDEAALAMFASLAALVIANARRHWDEQQARSFWQALVDLSPVGIWVFDAKTRDLTAINREALRIGGHQYGQGMSLDEVRANRGLRYLDGRDVPTEERPVSRVIRAGESIRAEELALIRPDGSAFPGLFSAAPIYSPQGEMSHVVLTVEDMRPRAELERLRAEFVGMVSHELRTPLTTIKGSAATALNAASSLHPAETRQFFRIIDQQADRMRDLINNLLDLSHIEAGQLSVNPEPADLSNIIEEARSAFQGRGRSGSVAVECPPGLPRVLADQQRVAQVLDNLLANAAKFSPEESTIDVAVARTDFHLEIAVTDRGRGIPAEHLDSIFTKFARSGHPESSGISEGHGLGLAICKGIVESHGGRIWVESDGPGQGARFTFTLPIADDTDSRAAAPTTGGPERTPVLIIDDDPQILRYLTHTLTEAGYDPVATDDLRQVERLLDTERPQLVLLDLMLPGGDAFDLLERTPALLELPVIFLSGNSEDRNITRALEMGAADYIIKPFSPTELVARIRAALRKRRADPTPPQTYVSGALAIDFARRSVSIAGDPALLTSTEYRLLSELARNAGRVLTHRQLRERVWGPEYADDNPRLLRAFVRSLRKKLGDDARAPTYILTEPRVGYRLAQAGPGDL